MTNVPNIPKRWACPYCGAERISVDKVKSAAAVLSVKKANPRKHGIEAPEVICSACGRKLTPFRIRHISGAIQNRSRKVFGGPPKRISACPWCGWKAGSVEIKEHLSVCPQKPAHVRPGRPAGRPDEPPDPKKKKAS